MKRAVRKEEGFTLVEIMVVIVIIGILAGLSVPIIAAQQKQTLQAEIRSEVRAITAEIKTMLVRYPLAADANVSGIIKGRFTDVINSHKMNSDSIQFQIGDTFVYDTNGNIVGANVNPASWKAYYVLAYDANDDGYYFYSYDSKTKKFTEALQ